MQKKRVSKKKLNTLDIPLVTIVGMLVAFGIVMILSASAPSALADYGNSYHYVIRQAFAVVMGVIALIFFSKVDYHRYLTRRAYITIYIASVGILFLTQFSSIAVSTNGATRWISIGPLSLQPSEITKIGLILAAAGYFTDTKKWGANTIIDRNKFILAWLVPTIALAIPAIILYKMQNHLSAAGVIAIVYIVMMITAGIKAKHFFGMFGAGGLLGVGYLFLKKDELLGGFRSNRIDAWLHIEEHEQGVGYQTLQSLYAIGSGGLFGVGLGKSTQKYLYIPEAHNDFIFSIIAEELGFIGALFVIALFVAFAIRGLMIANNAKDKQGSLIAVGITTLITIQAIINIAVVTNSMPNTGMALPFLSYGGTSVAILLGAVGIMLNVSRQGKKPEENGEK